MCPPVKLTVFFYHYLSDRFPEWNTVKKHSRKKQTGEQRLLTTRLSGRNPTTVIVEEQRHYPRSKAVSSGLGLRCCFCSGRVLEGAAAPRQKVRCH
jgi:hypothetical protein